MHKFAELIKDRFPNYKEDAKTAFKHPIDQWSNDLYVNDENDVFNELKNKYGNVKDRTKLIKLYQKIDLNVSPEDENAENDIAIYDAFLCTMIWGKIGLITPSNFTDVFNEDNKTDIIKKLKNVNAILKEKSMEHTLTAFKSMSRSKNNKITSVDTSYFTKYLYFMGTKIWPEEAQEGEKGRPLIYDGVMQKAYKLMLITEEGQLKKKTYTSIKDYEGYIEIMRQISEDLNLPNSGYFEALLFSDNVREYIKKELKNYKKNHNNKDNPSVNEIVDDDSQSDKKPAKEISKINWEELKNNFQELMNDAKINDNTCVIKIKDKGNYVLRLKIYKKRTKGSYQTFGIGNIIDGKEKERIINALKKEFDAKQVDFDDTIFVRNLDTNPSDDNQRIKWFADNIQKIIDIL